MFLAKFSNKFKLTEFFKNKVLRHSIASITYGQLAVSNCSPAAKIPLRFKELPAIFQNDACVHIYILHESFDEVFLGEKMLPENWLERNLEIKRAKEKTC